MSLSTQLRFVSSIAVLAAACSKADPEPAPLPTGPVGPAVPTRSAAQRLTRAQYANAIRDLFGDEVVVVPSALEPDVADDGLEAVGANTSTVSARGIEQYEKAATTIGQQVAQDTKLLSRVLSCKPASVDDDACARTFVSALGPRVYRRPLADGETVAIANVVTNAGKALGSFEKGVAHGIARMLQSPHFLYRPSVGEPDPERPGQRRLTSFELATRLSFFLWNSIPDDELFAAAKAGALDTFERVEAQVQRMLASPRAREGLRTFVREWLRLGELDLLQKDSKLFTTYTSDLGPMAREETLRVFEALVFDEDADIRDVMTTRRTFVTPKLASMYQVPAPSATGFAPVELPENGPRRGLLGHLSILALYAHPTSSSATLRGKFVREKLLCMSIPLPPVDLNTGLPEPSATARTLRERAQVHFTNPSCASCHLRMDPIGLGLEQFDGIGRLRTKENGAPIDPSGMLDGVSFAGPASLAQAIHDHPKLPSCIARKLYQYATGSAAAPEENATIDALTERFAAHSYRMKVLIAAVATSPAFRAHGEAH